MSAKVNFCFFKYAINPNLSIVFIAEVDIFNLTDLFNSGTKIFFICKFGNCLLLVLMFDLETLLPTSGLLLVILHIFDTITIPYIKCLNKFI